MGEGSNTKNIAKTNRKGSKGSLSTDSMNTFKTHVDRARTNY